MNFNMFNFLKNLFKKQEEVEPRATGYFKDVVDVRDIKLSQAQAPVALSGKKITDISMVTLFNQLYLGTCVVCAMVEMKIYQEYLETKKVLSFSRRILYVLARAICGLKITDPQGLFPRPTAKILTDVGVVPISVGADISEDNLTHTDYCSVNVTDQDKKKAEPYKVSGYAFPDVDDSNSLMQAIEQNGVFTVALDYDPSSWLKTLLKRVFRVIGGHYVLVYGYEVIGNDVKFYFRNSWGYLWGNNGNGEFMYSDYKGHIHDAICFLDLPNDLVERAKKTQYIFLRTLKKGMTGEDVKQLQKYLISIGLLNKADGAFGSLTEIAVKAFQRKNGLVDDGIFGKKSIEILNGVDNTKKVSLIDKWCQITEKIEGAKPELNNPGNHKYYGQKNAIGKDYRGFCIFPDYQTGYMEMRNLFVRACSGKSSNYKADMTLNEFYAGIEKPNRYNQKIGGYAPASDKNQPSVYAKSVAKYIGVSPDIEIRELLK